MLGRLFERIGVSKNFAVAVWPSHNRQTHRQSTRTKPHRNDNHRETF